MTLPRNSDTPAPVAVPAREAALLVVMVERHRGEPIPADELADRFAFALGYATALLDDSMRTFGDD